MPERKDKICTSKKQPVDWIAEPDDIIILVMGPTGVGKSTFINVAAGQTLTPVGHDLKSCTVDMFPIAVLHPGDPGRRVVFVDTPGFDDPLEDDAQILKRISGWMQRCYRANNELAGVLYLHDISQDRWDGPMRQSFGSFSTLFGINVAEHIVLVTTKWEQVQPDVGRHREELLSTIHWRKLLDQGSVLTRFGDSNASVWDIVTHVVERMPLRHILIQREIADLQKRLSSSNAYKSLNDNLERLLEKERKFSRILKSTPNPTPEHRAIYAELVNRIRSITEQIESLIAPLGHLLWTRLRSLLSTKDTGKTPPPTPPPSRDQVPTPELPAIISVQSFGNLDDVYLVASQA